MKQTLTIIAIAMTLSVASGLEVRGQSPTARAKSAAYRAARKARNPYRTQIRDPKLRPASGVVYVEDDLDLDVAEELAGWEEQGYAGDLLSNGGSCAGCGSGDCGPGGCSSGGCSTGTCGESCCQTCCPPRWAHRSGLFGEALYLRARDADVTYAAIVDGPTTPPGNPAQPGNQRGAMAIVDPDFEPAYRVGFARACTPCGSLRGSYTKFESTTFHETSANPNNGVFIHSLVTHPGVLNAEDNWLDASATFDVDYELADVAYHRLLSYSDRHAVNGFAGVRYGRLDQDFRADFSVLGTRNVQTDISFDGGGVRLGIHAERFASCSGLNVYGMGAASFLAGEFRGGYFQESSFATPEIETQWKAGRVVTILDLELGVGWTSCCGKVSIRAGYLFSAWLNTVATDEFIDAVNSNHFTDVGGDSMTFDGLTARAEYRF